MKINKYKKFSIFFLITSSTYLLLFLIEPIRKLINDPQITLRNDLLFSLVVFVLLINLLAYIYFFKNNNLEELDFKKIFFAYIVLNLVLLFVWPIGSNDVFSYIYQGRILSIYKSSPYLLSYSQFLSDPYYSVIANKWSVGTAPYGPLFIYISAFLTWLGNINIYLSLFLFKVIFTAANLFTAYFVYKLSNVKIFYLYAFNPLIIFELVINGHNDALLILTCVLSIFILLKKSGLKNYLISFFLLILSTLIKFTTIIFWPIFIVIILKSLKITRDKIIFLLLALLLASLIVFLAYAPLINYWQTIYYPLASQFGKASLYSPIIIITKGIADFFNLSLNFEKIMIYNRIFFIIFYLFILIKIIISKIYNLKTFLVKYQTLILLIFFLTFFSWLMPWYFTLLIALSGLAYYFENKQIYLDISYLCTFYGIICYFSLR